MLVALAARAERTAERANNCTGVKPPCAWPGEKESATACYGATLGSVGVTGALWRQTACAAGLGEDTRAHGVGDGAD